MAFHLNKKRIKKDIDPDEIFLDSKNLPNFNTQQFEGRIERPISKNSIFFLSLSFLIVGLVFCFRIFNLQILRGDFYFTKSENNTLDKQPIFADRGLIYDRNGILLAWNEWNKEDTDKLESPKRSYINSPGFGLLLGYVNPPAKDASGKYWQDNFIGKDGVEKFYNKELTGINGERITETDVKGGVQSENIVLPPVKGKDIYLSIDSRIQKKMYDSIYNMATAVGFRGGAGVLMNIKNGEILAMTSYPEYDNKIMSERSDKIKIAEYLKDNRKVFLNRVISGLYSPGSIVKPFFSYAALEEKIISPDKKILSNGSLSIPNPYYPGKFSVFKDHGTFGYVDMRKAIAVSSDVYFYQIGGGFENQKGLGIVTLDKYAKMFGIGDPVGIDFGTEKKGLIPTPEWKLKTFKGDPWRVGDTYNTSIGQYGFQVTPIQMLRSVSLIGGMGETFIPHLIKDDPDISSKSLEIPINKTNMKIVHEGMRMAVTEGTCMALNLPNIEVAAKSGTAQVGLGNTNTNSWIVGFFPYDDPKYAFALVLERGPKSASGNATRVMSEVVSYMKIYTSEYFD